MSWTTAPVNVRLNRWRSDERTGLFVGSDKGGETAAVLMSLCTTCKNLGIDPQAYLRDVLDRISTHPASRIEELLPDRWQELRQAGDAANGLTTPKPRVRLCPRRARVDCARRVDGLACSAFAPRPERSGGAGDRQPNDVQTMHRTVSCADEFW